MKQEKQSMMVTIADYSDLITTHTLEQDPLYTTMGLKIPWFIIIFRYDV